jgi:hypothetical protein
MEQDGLRTVVYKTSMWRTPIYFLNIGALYKAKDT